MPCPDYLPRREPDLSSKGNLDRRSLDDDATDPAHGRGESVDQALGVDARAMRIEGRAVQTRHRHSFMRGIGVEPHCAVAPILTVLGRGPRTHRLGGGSSCHHRAALGEAAIDPLVSADAAQLANRLLQSSDHRARTRFAV
ncbi:MAG: hypothetical protein V9G15_09025 [Dermatophilaceae bacterium]